MTNAIARISLSGFLAFVLFSSCQNKPQAVAVDNSEKKLSLKDSAEILRPSLWIYGMPDDKDRIRQAIDELYKFRFLIMGGCIVSDSLMIKTEIHNKITDSILTLRIGKNWRSRFEASVDSIFSIDSIAIAIAKSDKYILNFDTSTEKHNAQYDFYPNLRYTAHATVNENSKMVTIEGYGVINRRVSDLNYLRATVDLNLKKVIAIDKTPYENFP